MGRHDNIDVPAAAEGEAFAGNLPTVADRSRTQPGWLALSELAAHDETVRSASGAAKAGAVVRSMRLAAGLSQDQLAAASGMTQSVVSDIERGAGKIGPSFETLLRLAKACGMDIGFAPLGIGAAPAPRPDAQRAADTVMKAALDRIDEDLVARYSHFMASLEAARPGHAKRSDRGKGFGFARAAGGAGEAFAEGETLGRAAAVVVGKVSLGRTVIEVSSEGLLRVHEGNGRDVVYAPISVRTSTSSR